MDWESHLTVQDRHRSAKRAHAVSVMAWVVVGCALLAHHRRVRCEPTAILPLLHKLGVGAAQLYAGNLSRSYAIRCTNDIIARSVQV